MEKKSSWRTTAAAVVRIRISIRLLDLSVKRLNARGGVM